MTKLPLSKYLANNPNISWQQQDQMPNAPIVPNMPIWIYDYTTEAWRLSDYVVSGVVSGPAVVLIPRKPA